MFRLSTNSCSVVMTEIEKERMMTVERYHSFVGGVHLSWEILDSNGQLAISEFLAANGSVEFSGDEKTKVLYQISFDSALRLNQLRTNILESVNKKINKV